MLAKIFPFCLLAMRLKGKQELERAKGAGVLARLKSPIPIKGSQAIYSTKTHFKTSPSGGG